MSENDNANPPLTDEELARQRAEQRRLGDRAVTETSNSLTSRLSNLFGRGNNTSAQNQNSAPPPAPTPVPSPSSTDNPPSDQNVGDGADASAGNTDPNHPPSDPNQSQDAGTAGQTDDPANNNAESAANPADSSNNGSTGDDNPAPWNAGGAPPPPPRTPWWKRLFGSGANGGGGNSGGNRGGGGNSGAAGDGNRNMIYLIIFGILFAFALVGWQLWQRYRASQAIDSPVNVERNPTQQQARISGQQVSQDYADKLKIAEEERRKGLTGGSSFIPQTVDVLNEKDECPNCAERITNLETATQQMSAAVTQMADSVTQLNENQQNMSSDIADLRNQMANLPRQTQPQAQPQPIPEARRYKDYKGHEYLSAEYLNAERTTMATQINQMAARSRGEGLQHYAAYNPPQERQSNGSDAQVKGPESIPVGLYSGQLEIGVNTDKGISPLVATINAGPLRGTRLIARGYTAEREGVQIVFTEFVTSKGQRGTITAYAIDADTKVAGVASSVDKHITSRVLGAAITRTIQGWGDAYANQGTTISTDNGIITQTRSTDSRSAIRQGIGAGAGAVADIFAEMATRPTTIEVEAHGYEIGIYVVDPGVVGAVNTNVGSR